MKKFKIREAVEKDSESILNLIKELAAFEKEPDEVSLTIEDLAKDGFGIKPKFKCFVAESKKKIVGIALFYPCYSSWKGASWHLEDLIVTKSFRGLGIGFSLLKKFIEFANSTNVRRIQWVVLDWNLEAINFYKKFGASTFDNWKITQMDDKAIDTFINNQ